MKPLLVLVLIGVLFLSYIAWRGPHDLIAPHVPFFLTGASK